MTARSAVALMLGDWMDLTGGWYDPTYVDGRGPWPPRIVPLARLLQGLAEPMRLGLVVLSPTSPPEARLVRGACPLRPVLFPLAESHVCGANLTALPSDAAGLRKAVGQAAYAALALAATPVRPCRLAAHSEC